MKSTGLPRVVFVITDSKQTDGAKIIQFVHKNSRYIKTFCLGVGKPDEKLGHFSVPFGHAGKAAGLVYDEKV